jgi:hypothetical protein
MNHAERKSRLGLDRRADGAGQSHQDRVLGEVSCGHYGGNTEAEFLVQKAGEDAASWFVRVYRGYDPLEDEGE